MLIIDQLQKDDARLRVVAVVVLIGLLVLAGGLWRLQVMAAQRYARSEEAQSVRLVRVPAVRGKILDRNGIALVENRPSYDVNLYVEELRSSFVREYTNQVLPNFRAKASSGASANAEATSDSPRWWQFFSKKGKTRGGLRLTVEQRRDLQETARVTVYSNTVQTVGQSLGRPLPISSERFLRHYRQDLALPLPVAENLTASQMALFFERCLGLPGVDRACDECLPRTCSPAPGGRCAYRRAHCWACPGWRCLRPPRSAGCPGRRPSRRSRRSWSCRTGSARRPAG